MHALWQSGISPSVCPAPPNTVQVSLTRTSSGKMDALLFFYPTSSLLDFGWAHHCAVSPWNNNTFKKPLEHCTAPHFTAPVEDSPTGIYWFMKNTQSRKHKWNKNRDFECLYVIVFKLCYAWKHLLNLIILFSQYLKVMWNVFFSSKSAGHLKKYKKLYAHTLTLPSTRFYNPSLLIITNTVHI